ncbi:MAG: OadG family protein [Clostridiales bacterium]|nr:OadG family protein [Clostridiales bacterium]
MNPYIVMLKEGVLPMSEAFMDAGIVILVVFVVLVIMCLLISLSGKILQNVGKETSAPAASQAASTPAPAEEDPGEEFSSGTLKLKGCDEKTAAMIMAIVSDNTGIPLSELVFKSITLVEEK